MKRILICTAEYPPDPGGIGEYSYQVANYLHHHHYTVGVLALQAYSTQETIEQFNHSQPYSIYKLPSKSDWKQCWVTIRKFRPDIVITSDLPLTFYLWLICKLLNIHLVVIGHGSEFRYSRFPTRQLKQFIFNHVDKLIANSQFTLKLVERLGVDISNMHIVYPGGSSQLSPNVDSQHLRERYGLEGKRVLLTLGGLSYRKGQHIVLKAMPKILEQFPDVHYVMAGRDRSNGDMLALAQELDIEKHVTFVGQFNESEKSAFFHLSEFCLITSQNLNTGAVEGYGIVIIEAALCQQTSIGTLDTGTQEAIIHEQTGLLVPQDNVNAVAEASIRLLSDIPYRNKLAQTAYQDAITNATWEKRMMRFEAIIAELDS